MLLIHIEVQGILNSFLYNHRIKRSCDIICDSQFICLTHSINSIFRRYHDYRSFSNTLASFHYFKTSKPFICGILISKASDQFQYFLQSSGLPDFHFQLPDSYKHLQESPSICPCLILNHLQSGFLSFIHIFITFIHSFL